MGATVSPNGSSSDVSAEENSKSRLDLLLSNHAEWSVDFPSLSLSTPKKAAVPSDSRSAAHLAETCMERPVRYNATNVSSASEDMARSAAGTVKSLICANLRSFARMRDFQNSWDATTSMSFASRISDPALVRVSRVSSKFIQVENTEDANSYQLRLRANFSLDIDVGGINEHISVDASGQITGCNTSDSSTVNRINVQLDCTALLAALRQHARLAAYKFITRNVSASVLESSANVSAQLAFRNVKIVTPCSSPMLSILSTAAATLVEPLSLDEAPSKRQVASAQHKTLPPKKRPRRAASPPLSSSSKQVLPGSAARTAVAE